MASNKKPRKAYKPKPVVKPLGMRNAHMMEFPGYAASLVLGTDSLESQHIYDILANADMTRRIAPDGHAILAIAQAMVYAIANIRERHQKTGKLGVSGDEFRVLREGIGKTMEYLRSVPNVAIERAARAAVEEFNKTGVLRV